MATIADCTCPICLCILIEPVTMPCRHSICLPCYKQTVEKANLCCPMCRLRISVWARKSAKAGTLVDVAKWDAIQKEFPVQVQKRLEGKEMLDDEDDLQSYETRLRQLMAVSKPGEIREEYEAELRKLQQCQQEEAKREEEASAALIRSLQREEENEKEALVRLQEEQDRLDREIAEKLQETFVSEDDEVRLEESGVSATSSAISARSSAISEKDGKSMNKKPVKTVKGKGKQLKPAASNNLTMATFFSPVPRETGPTSPIYGHLAPRKLYLGTCDDTDLASHNFLYDLDSHEPLSPIPEFESKRFVSSNEHFLGHKNSSVGTFGKSSNDDPLEHHTGGGGVICGTNRNLKTSDRFRAGPSGLARGGIVTSAEFPGLRNHVPANRASSTPASGRSVGNPLGRSLAADGEAAGVNTDRLGLSLSKARFFKTSSLTSTNETVNSGGSPLHTQPAHAAERCSDRQKASVLSQRKTFENTEDVKSNMTSEDVESRFHETLLAATENVNPSRKNPTQTAHGHVNGTVDPASMLNKCENLLAGSGDGSGVQKCKDMVNGWSHDDDAVSNYTEATDGDGDDTASHINGFISPCYTDPADSDSLTEFSVDLRHSGPQAVHKPSLEKQSKTSRLISKCNTEKENRIGVENKQQTDWKMNSQLENHRHKLNPTVKVYRMKTHSAKKPKKTVLSVAGKTEAVVSIMRWCVPNDSQVLPDDSQGVPNECQGELENGQESKNTVADKREPGRGNNQRILGYCGKRKNPDYDEDEEKNNDEMQVDLNGYRKQVIANKNDAFCKKKKRFPDDLVIHSSAPEWQETPATGGWQETSATGVLDLDDVDQSGMSLEDLDHLMAVRLQEVYSRLDQQNIKVDRFRGSKDQYMLRKKSDRR